MEKYPFLLFLIPKLCSVLHTKKTSAPESIRERLSFYDVFI